MNRRNAVLAVLAIILVLLTALLFITQRSKEVGGGAGISIVGNQFELNGKPWFPKSVQFVALTCPPDDSSCPKFVSQAYSHFGPAEWELARQKWDVDLLELLVDEGALDPQNPQYSQAYLNELSSTTAAAEHDGFEVLWYTIDNHETADPNYLKSYQTASTLRADETLAKLFGSDPNVMIDPGTGSSLNTDKQYGAPLPEDLWQLWLNGGSVPSDPSTTLIGEQQLISNMRASGSKNVLIIETMAGRRIDGIPDLQDPLNQYAIGLSPIPAIRYDYHSPVAWERYYGFYTAHPLIVINEAGMVTNPNNMGEPVWCSGDTWQLPTTFFAYLASKDIPGLGGFSFDTPPGHIVDDWNGTPSSYYNPATHSDYTCQDNGGAPGILNQNYLLAHASDDTTPPSTPDPKIMQTTSTSITLSWNPSSDNKTGVVGYNIYRNGTFVDMTLASSTIPYSDIKGSTSFTDTGLSPKTTYQYQVDAFDWASNHSPDASVNATTNP